MAEWAEMKALEGRYVEVLLQESPAVYVTGVLVHLSEDGEVCLEVDGAYEWSWPALEVTALD